MDTEICHVMLAGHIYKLFFMLLCLITVLTPFHHIYLVWRKSLQLSAQTRLQEDLQELPFFKYHVELIHQVESLLCSLLLCLVVNTTVIYSELLPHAIFVRAQCWPTQAEDCRLCYCFFQAALHANTEWRPLVAQYWDYQMPFFGFAHSTNLRSFLGPSFNICSNEMHLCQLV